RHVQLRGDGRCRPRPAPAGRPRYRRTPHLARQRDRQDHLARALSLLVWGLVSSALAAVASAEGVSAVALVRNPAPYRNRIITVPAILLNPGPAGVGGLAFPPPGVFDLSAGPALLQVLTLVPPACPVRSMVTVEGRLLLREQVGQNIYTNVIRAITIICR